MTTIPALLVVGHRLFNALLTEARLALADEDWPDVLKRLREFETRIEQHMQAEERILFPKLALLNPNLNSALAQCRREHTEITARTEAALCSASEHDKPQCARIISELIDFLSCHCFSEERCVYTVTPVMDEDLMMKLANELGSATDDTQAWGADAIPAVVHRLH